MQYRRYRAPVVHGASLVDPSLADVRLVRDPRLDSIELLGASLSTVRREARKELIALACEYTRAYRDIDEPLADRPIVMSGHQPQLFHPGVWFKNFVLSECGATREATAINLIIDNDLCRTTSIRVPGGTDDRPRTASVPFDAAAEPIPYEERAIKDRELLDSFAQRALGVVGSVIPDPLVCELWHSTTELRRGSEHLGQYIAQARHSFEGQLGLTSLEVPWSCVCDADSFTGFVAAILGDLPRVHQAYNASLREYRAVNRVRSPLHPLPDLSQEGSWWEAPFWIWSEREPSRQRLFVQLVGDDVGIGLRENPLLTCHKSDLVGGIAALRQRGYKVRPRALTTTMYARLVLSDLFIHGIGGGKYDQVTDAIIERLFEVKPPPFVVVTATWRLPQMREMHDAASLTAIDESLRKLRYHPEVYAEPGPEVERVAAEKRSWIEQDLPRGARLKRHQHITQANEQLQPYVRGRRDALLQTRADVATRVRNSQILGSREFSFCLFPKESLSKGLLELARKAFYINGT